MPDQHDGNQITDDTADDQIEEDQGFDNFDDAANALADDVDEISDDEGADETDDAAEGDESDVDEPETDELEPDELSDALITLPDGETMTVGELEVLRGNGLREADYTRKTMELSDERKAFEGDKESVSLRSQHLETAFTGLIGFLEKVIPPEPHINLARSNPTEYHAQLAERQATIAELTPLLQMQDAAKSGLSDVSTADMQRYQQGQEAELQKALPHLKDPVKFKAFRDTNKKAALEFGFSEEEFDATHDARLMQVINLARLGKIAQSNRKNALRRVETPKKGKAKAATKVVNTQSQKAMQRLRKSGSLEDAMQIDFD